MNEAELKVLQDEIKAMGDEIRSLKTEKADPALVCYKYILTEAQRHSATWYALVEFKAVHILIIGLFVLLLFPEVKIVPVF
ncbi:hypothetical protein Y032_0081g1411 [Ancylostoma ceylanicum]|uniref:Uncharacterized protein n=1 Tax=Ancylostoma ceylanicum TaxID=53326 RepID=A0A016TRZ2_9BILA|nr:hypothetical protein Y032_0081g1411 [Ancylostoma ceylanicum]